MTHSSDITGTVGRKPGGRAQIAVISSSALAARGLASLVECAVPAAGVRVFRDFRELSENAPGRFCHYFVTPEILLQAPRFFLERAKRTIVVAAGHAHSQIPKDFRTIDAAQREKDLVRSFLLMLQQAHGGGRLIPPQAHSAGGRTRCGSLTPREKDVLREIVLGRINKEIARRLNISLPTVVSHRRHIMEKLHAKSVPALTIYAVMHGIAAAEEV